MKFSTAKVNSPIVRYTPLCKPCSTCKPIRTHFHKPHPLIYPPRYYFTRPTTTTTTTATTTTTTTTTATTTTTTTTTNTNPRFAIAPASLQFVGCLCVYDGFLTAVDLQHSALLADLAVDNDSRTYLNYYCSSFGVFAASLVPLPIN